MSLTKIISIEGNIGSGKSTFLHFLKEKFNGNSDVIFLREPVDEWESIKDSEGKTMLCKFYENSERYSFSFQMMAYISRLSIIIDAIKKNPKMIITERCLLTDKHIFAKMLYDDKKMEDVEFQIYNKWFNEFNKQVQVTNIVYIKTDPVKCFQRIKTRARVGEDTIPLEYLEKCDFYHDQFIDNCESSATTIRLNGNIDVDELSKDKIYADWAKSMNISELESKRFNSPKQLNL